jgi:hypothetical protein
MGASRSLPRDVPRVSISPPKRNALPMQKLHLGIAPNCTKPRFPVVFAGLEAVSVAMQRM